MNKLENNPLNNAQVIKHKMPLWKVLFVWAMGLGIVGAVAIAIAATVLYMHFARDLPDFRKLANYQPSLITKVYANNGEVLAEFAKERRIYVPYSEIPRPLVDSFLAAEDTGFFEHGGYDAKAIIRAALTNILTHKRQGASTITQQVAKTFLLSSEQTYSRKIKELILSRRIEKTFSKEEILELYLNQIYLGHGAYGIVAAAQTYFSKTLDELTLTERALIAGLPKAPSRYSPINNPERAKARRDIIIRRLEAEGYITAEEADKAVATPLNLNPLRLTRGQLAPHFSEQVRRDLLNKFGKEMLYSEGLHVYSTIDIELQQQAENAVYRGLRAYDRRHGWRGPLGKLGVLFGWETRLEEYGAKYSSFSHVGVPAVVLSIKDNNAQVGLLGGGLGNIPYAEVTWARPFIDHSSRGPKPRTIEDVLAAGDVILVKKKTTGDDKPQYSLEQIPDVQGALVALDSATGAIRAMVGGFAEDGSGFNRAVQGKRQVGSAFKPIVYTAALEEAGYTPASIILDAPVVFRSEEGDWKPQNYSNRIYGPSTLRMGIEKSRNLMTIRLAKDIGMRRVADMAGRFGLERNFSTHDLANSLGTMSYSTLDLTSAYSVFPNQGKRVEPYSITRVQSANGDTILRHYPECKDCFAEAGAQPDKLPELPAIPAEQVISPQTAYQMTYILQGVVDRGTAVRARSIKRSIGGKTGTTNDYIDAWFVGFSPQLTVGVWVGFDKPQTLGRGEAGSKAALPIWIDFMKVALKDELNTTFKVPEGITFVKIDAETGLLPSLTTKSTILEAFKVGTEPKVSTPVGSSEIPGVGIQLDGIY